MTKSVIIPFHSNDNLLAACLYSVSQAIDPEDEIIVVANNADQSALNFNFSDFSCKVIYRYENLMYPKAINLGAYHAKGDYLLFCDADIYAHKHALSALLQGLANNHMAAYASAKLLDFQTRRIWEFGTASSEINFPHPYRFREIDYPLCKSDRIVWGACAACSAIKKETFLQIGGFDERLVCSYSDLDLAIRLRDKLGMQTICVADSLAYHQGGSTIGSGMDSFAKEDTKGIFLSKHPNIQWNLDQYIKDSCVHFRNLYKHNCREYICVDASSIVNAQQYIDCFSSYLDIRVLGEYRFPPRNRDAQRIDLINHVHHSLRSYQVPLLYFVDSYTALGGNSLWKECRCQYDDIVIDRHANVELLANI